jgi:hypothetical protein
MRSPSFILCGLLLRKPLINSDGEFQLMRQPTGPEAAGSLAASGPFYERQSPSLRIFEEHRGASRHRPHRELLARRLHRVVDQETGAYVHRHEGRRDVGSTPVLAASHLQLAARRDLLARENVEAVVGASGRCEWRRVRVRLYLEPNTHPCG